jgi:dTDP-4-amino-4,6-dideoxygalactose transaminase
MSNVHAAIGVEQMKKIDELNAARRDHAAYLTERLEEIPGVEPPVEPHDREHVYQMYTILTDDSIDRNAFVDALNQAGIGASVHFYPPAHEQPRYEAERYRAGDLTVTEEVSRGIVTLPMYPLLDVEELEYIADIVAATTDTLR